MASDGHGHSLGRLLAEELAMLIQETGNERLAGERLRKGIDSGRYTVSAENRDGTAFTPPNDCTWRTARYARDSTAWWLTGPEPVKANPLAGKVRPADTRKRVVAYAVRLLAKERLREGAIPPNRGGSPGKWNWSALETKLPVKGQPFEDLPAFEEWCANNVKRVDGKLQKNPPDTRSVRAAIKKHRLDQIPDLFKRQ
jgi:hypothetical protein